MIKLTKLIVLLLLLFSGINVAQSIEVLADTDSSEYYVGDYIKYKIAISHDQDITIDMPSVKDSISNLDFIKEFPPKISEGINNKKISVYDFVFSKYDSSEITIPQFNINFTQAGDPEIRTIRTNPVTILVKTLEVDSDKDIQDVKKPMRISLDWWVILLIVLLILAVLTGSYFGYKYYKSKKEGTSFTAPKIVIPPHKIAIKELSELEGEKLWQRGEVKEYHSRITYIVRKYFENRFNFFALEQTSAEILGVMKNISETGIIHDSTKQFLENADMVKFAKFQPMPTVNEEMMKQAYDIVNKTKQKEELFEKKGTSDV
ncbi:MAG: hypothetical protein K9J12_02285 [Melioribacteraceae bacterium]|nr:hypothetical protein [Melioribacteraceae bacterium]MCF8263857.1 hypothetical protein [Melioribacteraceae bacterium]